MTSPLLVNTKPVYTFNPQEIEYYKAERQKKSQTLGRDYWTSKYTWIGEPCERLFAGFLVKHNIAYTRWAKDDIKDDRDFTCYGAEIDLEIDVKATSSHGGIHPDYYFYVGEEQYNRIMAPGSITNCFVFVYYNRTTNQASVEGYLTKEEFRRLSLFYKKGTIRGGKALLSSDYAVFAYQIHPINSIIRLLEVYDKVVI